MKKGMRKVLEDVVLDVLRRLPPDVPEFKKIKNFGVEQTIGKVKRKRRYE
jgi:hypothetical protein